MNKTALLLPSRNVSSAKAASPGSFVYFSSQTDLSLAHCRCSVNRCQMSLWLLYPSGDRDLETQRWMRRAGGRQKEELECIRGQKRQPWVAQEPGREETPFGFPTQCLTSQEAGSHPPPSLASWPLSPLTGGPAQISPTPGCVRQAV